MKPYYEADGVTIYHGDSREIMRRLYQCDAVITDPPYNVRSEDIALEGRSPMRRDFGNWDEDWHPSELLTESLRLLPIGGSLLAFTSDRLLSKWRESDGWKARSTIVWEKTNPAPNPRPSYVSATEYIIWLQKPGAAAIWNASGYTPNLLRYPVCGGLERFHHPTQKPEGLMCELIARHTDAGHRVLDPFMGSGTTLVAAKRLGRRGVGIEICEEYCEIAAQRLAQGALPLEHPA